MKIAQFDANYPRKLGDTTLSQGGGVTVDTGNSGSTGGGGVTLVFSVTDGVTTVDPTTELTFVAATLTDLGGGNAEITLSGGGSGSLSTPTVAQTARSAGLNTTNPTLTLGSTPVSGHRIVLGLNLVGRGATGVASTNTTWTQMITSTSSGGTRYEVWVGVAAASAGTVITVSTGSSNYASIVAMEIADTLTPTAGAYVSAAQGPTISGLPTVSAILTTTSGRLLVFLYGADNTTNDLAVIPSVPHVGMTGKGANGTALAVGYAPNGSVSMTGVGGTTGTLLTAWGLIIEIT